MSSLNTIWTSKDLTGGTLPPAFDIPNSTNTQTLKINNQSRYWLIIFKAQTSEAVDRIEPFSYLTIPYQPDLSLKIEDGDAVTSLNPEKEFVDYSTFSGAVEYSKGSTQFIGSSSVIIEGNVTIGNSSIDVAIQGTPTFNLAAGNSVTIANSLLDVTIQGTPTFNLAAGATVDVTGSAVSIAGTPSVNISNSSLNVAITGTPTFNLGSGNSVVIESGSVNIAGTADTIVNNDQLSVTQVYNGSAVLTYPAGVTSKSFDVAFLSPGHMATIHKGYFYIKTTINDNLIMNNVALKVQFADGTTFSVPNASYTPTAIGNIVYNFEGESYTCNIFTVTLTVSTALAAAANLTLYWHVDSNETSIDTPKNAGVPVMPSYNFLNNASGTIRTANTAQDVLSIQSSNPNRMQYIFFQNISPNDMYINWIGNAGLGGAADILISANGGSMTFEGSFVPNDDLSVCCSVAGSAFTCIYASTPNYS